MPLFLYTVSIKLEISCIEVKSKNKIKFGNGSTKTYDDVEDFAIEDILPNRSACLITQKKKLFHTQYVSIISNERNFSKLKLIKIYLRDLKM